MNGGICSQNFLIEYLEIYNFLKSANANSIYADVKSIIQIARWHFFASMMYFELERVDKQLYEHILPNRLIIFIESNIILAYNTNNKWN